MNNFIKEWSWERPTEEGYYLMCYGDVRTAANVEPISIVHKFDHLSVIDLKGERTALDSFGGSYQWAKLIYSPIQIKELDNAEN